MSHAAAKLTFPLCGLLLAAAALPQAAQAQGVPIADGKSIIQHSLEIAQMSYLTGARELEADKKRRIDALHQEQLDACLMALGAFVRNKSRRSTFWNADLRWWLDRHTLGL